VTSATSTPAIPQAKPVLIGPEPLLGRPYIRVRIQHPPWEALRSENVCASESRSQRDARSVLFDHRGPCVWCGEDAWEKEEGVATETGAGKLGQVPGRQTP
jgi:hypothetical protein